MRFADACLGFDFLSLLTTDPKYEHRLHHFVHFERVPVSHVEALRCTGARQLRCSVAHQAGASIKTRNVIQSFSQRI
jgi:hypothetical protein